MCAMQTSDLGQVMAILESEFAAYPMPVVDLIEVQGGEPYRILVATLLSARTQDGTTAAAAGRLFARAANLNELGSLSEDEISELIFPVGFFRQKAKHLVALPQVINERFGGQIPAEIDELCQLPGVGRKTANLVRALAFHQPAICVDTHVHRINNRLGYVATATPFETEMQLRAKLPEEYWLRYNAVFVSFGQHTCRPQKPKCAACPIARYCQRVGVI